MSARRKLVRAGNPTNVGDNTDQVQYTTAEAAEFSNNPSRLDVNNAYNEIVTNNGEQTAVSV